jgi:hypothetical protein
MILLTISNFTIYCSLVWGTNMLLNVLGIIKMHIPTTKRLDRPIDGGLEYKGDRLVGESTTIAGIILCLIISAVLFFITHNFIWAIIPMLVYLGHMSGSIIKRRMHKNGGEFVPFIDHGDYTILTGFVFVLLHYITPLFAILNILITYIIHPIVCVLAFKLKLREHPY